MNDGSAWTRLIANPDAADAPAEAVPNSLATPATGGGGVGSVVRAVVIAIRTGRGTADDGSGGKPAEHAGGDGATTRLRGSGRGDRSDRQGRGCSNGGQGSSHSAPLKLM